VVQVLGTNGLESGMNLMLSDPDMANIEKGLERIERFCQGLVK
jgi:hypothetical protein